MEEYEKGFRERARKREKVMDRKGAAVSVGSRTKGKHVSSLCQACKKGVCSVNKFNLL